MNRMKMKMMMGQGGVSWQFDEQVLTLPNLIGYWPGEELTGSTLIDASENGKTGAYFGSPAVTLGQPGIGDGKPSVYYPGSGGAAFTASLAAVITPGLFSVFQWVYLDPSCLADNLYHYSLFHQVDANNRMSLYKANTTNRNSLRGSYTAGGVACVTGFYDYDSIARWLLVMLTINKSDDRMRWFVDGIQQGADVKGLGTYVGAPTNLYIGTAAGSNWKGWIAKTGVTNAEISPQTAWALSGKSRAISSTVNNILWIGDSKTASYDTQWMLAKKLQLATGQTWRETPAKIATGGINAATMAGEIDADLTARAGLGMPTHIIINLGANDVTVAPDKSTWKANILYIVNACHVAYPDAKIYLTKIWRHDGDYLANCATLNTGIDELYAGYPAILYPFIDEGNYLPGSDDGVTYTVDKVHPNAAGFQLLASGQARAILEETWL